MLPFPPRPPPYPLYLPPALHPSAPTAWPRYDAAVADEESPVQRWIGREVKRFLEQAHEHIPFLLRVVQAPAEALSHLTAEVNGAGEVVMESESDDEWEPTADETDAESSVMPDLEEHAGYWDHFLELVRECHGPSATWTDDSDEYRELRAINAFNLGILVSNDLITLSPLMMSWVPHILVFIVPRQILELGEPARRSCDSCESFGAMAKKVIKHLTCRRDTSARFTKGYVQQCFERLCLRHGLIHGAENGPYLQRADARLLSHGKQRGLRRPATALKSAFASVKELIFAPTVPTELQEKAFMA